MHREFRIRTHIEIAPLTYVSNLADHEHVLQGSSGRDALEVFEVKLEGKSAQGRPRRMWCVDKSGLI